MFELLSAKIQTKNIVFQTFEYANGTQFQMRVRKQYAITNIYYYWCLLIMPKAWKTTGRRWSAKHGTPAKHTAKHGTPKWVTDMYVR